ncbi:putative bifunctional diguanylate cyclase/phosphodiesterase [Sediminibacillus albus]|nr:GGDEF domain-containing phosphodiesterase [Sediminibacillus albus]
MKTDTLTALGTNDDKPSGSMLVELLDHIEGWEYKQNSQEIILSDAFHKLLKTNQVGKTLPAAAVTTLIHREDRRHVIRTFLAALKEKAVFRADFRLVVQSQVIYLRVVGETIINKQRSVRMIGVVQDVSNLLSVKQQLKEEQQQSKYIFDQLNSVIWMKSLQDRKINYISKGCNKLFGYQRDQFLENYSLWEKSVHPEDKQVVAAKQKLLSEGQPLSHQYRIITSDGQIKWVHDQTIPNKNADGTISYLFGMVTDISEEKAMEERLSYMVNHHPLTNLPNRNVLDKRLNKLIKEDNDPFALLYLDLDKFKVINDSLGHKFGDKVLQVVAGKLQTAAPDNGLAVCMEGNEFVLLLDKYTSKKDVFRFAEHIIQLIESTMDIEGYELHIKASIGISFYPDNGSDKEQLLHNAHRALFHVKKSNDYSYHSYSSSNGFSSFTSHFLEEEMRAAIAREEFELHYQPKVGTTGKLLGGEALIRWNHPKFGRVSPGEFIPFAEENHLINEIGDWVIQTVCRQLGEWRDKGFALYPISINISPMRFMKKGLVELIEKNLDTFQIPAELIVLEITESTLLKNEKVVIKTLEKLGKLGIKIAIDDFGTGYASLTYLKEFQADILKIDQSFIRNLGNNRQKDNAIVSSICHMGKALGMTVVAEGVEEQEQLELLAEFFCDEIQGYLFSKPLPAAGFEKVLGDGRLQSGK